MISYSDLLATYHAEAIKNTLESTEVAVHRQICREYSKAFHTPLHLVLKMDPAEVILAFYEEQLSNFNPEEDGHIESLLDRIYALEDPEYEKEKRREMDDFDKKAEEEEEERLAEGRPIHKGMTKSILENDLEEPKMAVTKRRTGGKLTFDQSGEES